MTETDGAVLLVRPKTNLGLSGQIGKVRTSIIWERINGGLFRIDFFLLSCAPGETKRSSSIPLDVKRS